MKLRRPWRGFDGDDPEEDPAAEDRAAEDRVEETEDTKLQ